jgi:sec-independent protein translocase protein TatB
MFDIAWSELMLIGAVALVVIGPKDLPKALRTVGQTIGKVRRMAGEFQSQFNEAMREAELDDVKKQVEDVGGSVQSAMNSDFKPIDQINDFGAPKAVGDDASLKEAEAKLAALPGPEPLPEITIDPAPVAEPVPEVAAEPEAKPKRKRTAKPKVKAAEVTEPGEGSPA